MKGIYFTGIDLLESGFENYLIIINTFLNYKKFEKVNDL